MDVSSRVIASQSLTSSDSLSIGVIGGGVVGSLAAISLSKALSAVFNQFQIEVFEQFPQPSAQDQAYQQQYDARNLVVSSASVDYFKQLQLWQQLSSEFVPIEELHISRLAGFGRSQIKAQDEGVEALGYVADMAQLTLTLLDLAQQDMHIHCHFNAKITKLTPIQQGYIVTTDTSSKQFDLIIIADGQYSWACKQLGIAGQEKMYPQQALVTNITLEQPVANIAYEQFFRGGAITLLPLTQQGYQHRMALVWIDQLANLERLEGVSDLSFLQQLARHLPAHLVPTQKGHSKIYPLRFQVRHERVRPHLVVIGNAAQSLHPIAAQGFNLAVRDIRDFTHTFAAQVASLGVCPALFSGSSMQAFANARAQDVSKVSSFVQLLNLGFFSTRALPFSGLLQDLALTGFETIPGAKAGLSRFAMAGRPQTHQKASY